MLEKLLFFNTLSFMQNFLLCLIIHLLVYPSLLTFGVHILAVEFTFYYNAEMCNLVFSLRTCQCGIRC